MSKIKCQINFNHQLLIDKGIGLEPCHCPVSPRFPICYSSCALFRIQIFSEFTLLKLCNNVTIKFLSSEFEDRRKEKR